MLLLPSGRNQEACQWENNWLLLSHSDSRLPSILEITGEISGQAPPPPPTEDDDWVPIKWFSFTAYSSSCLACWWCLKSIETMSVPGIKLLLTFIYTSQLLTVVSPQPVQTQCIDCPVDSGRMIVIICHQFQFNRPATTDQEEKEDWQSSRWGIIIIAFASVATKLFPWVKSGGLLAGSPRCHPAIVYPISSHSSSHRSQSLDTLSTERSIESFLIAIDKWASGEGAVRGLQKISYPPIIIMAMMLLSDGRGGMQITHSILTSNCYSIVKHCCTGGAVYGQSLLLFRVFHFFCHLYCW